MSTGHVQYQCVAWIGWSHLLQPPLTFWLATRVLRLRAAFDSLPLLAARVAKVMALVAVGLPTALGVLVAWYVRPSLAGGAVSSLAIVLAGGLWTPRLLAQLFWIGPCFSKQARAWHWLLVAIFTLQGPCWLALLLW